MSASGQTLNSLSIDQAPALAESGADRRPLTLRRFLSKADVMKTLVPILAIALCLMLASCGKTHIYRYKLTLSLETPEGIKTAFNVVEVGHWEVIVPDGAARTGVKGEALYLDLGAGRQPLVALLSGDSNKFFGQRPHGHWDFGSPTNALGRLFGVNRQGVEWLDFVGRVAKQRGEREMDLLDLPNLVTFADPTDPNTIAAVDPRNLEATLGPGVRWHRMTLAITNEPITTGLDLRLPWLRTIGTNHLDGQYASSKKTLANSLQAIQFKSGVK
jgi:hypothetical protein